MQIKILLYMNTNVLNIFYSLCLHFIHKEFGEKNTVFQYICLKVVKGSNFSYFLPPINIKSIQTVKSCFKSEMIKSVLVIYFKSHCL